MPRTTISKIVGSSPGVRTRDKARTAFLRSFRTTLQALAASIPSAGAGSAILSIGYWEALGLSALTAVMAGVASFLQNVATFLPVDPTQRDEKLEEIRS